MNFEKGDTVYHWKHGKEPLTIIREDGKDGRLLSQSKNGIHLYNASELSFTPYELMGFSQTRPDRKLEAGMVFKFGSELRFVLRGGKGFIMYDSDLDKCNEFDQCTTIEYLEAEEGYKFKTGSSFEFIEKKIKL